MQSNYKITSYPGTRNFKFNSSSNLRCQVICQTKNFKVPLTLEKLMLLDNSKHRYTRYQITQQIKVYKPPVTLMASYTGQLLTIALQIKPTLYNSNPHLPFQKGNQTQHHKYTLTHQGKPPATGNHSTNTHCNRKYATPDVCNTA